MRTVIARGNEQTDVAVGPCETGIALTGVRPGMADTISTVTHIGLAVIDCGLAVLTRESKCAGARIRINSIGTESPIDAGTAGTVVYLGGAIYASESWGATARVGADCIGAGCTILTRNIGTGVENRLTRGSCVSSVAGARDVHAITRTSAIATWVDYLTGRNIHSVDVKRTVVKILALVTAESGGTRAHACIACAAVLTSTGLR